MSWWSWLKGSSSNDSGPFAHQLDNDTQSSTFYIREDRFNIGPLHDVILKVQFPGTDYFKEVQVRNLSSTGLAFCMPKGYEQIPTNCSINAEVHINNNVHLLVLNVRHHNNKSVGCLVENHRAGYSEMIEKYFVDEISAAELAPVDSEKLKPDADGIPHYLLGTKGQCGLYYVENAGNVIKFQINVLGNTIEVDKTGEITYGFILDNDLSHSKEEGPRVVVKVNSLPSEIIQHAQRFVSNIDILAENIKKQVCEKVECKRSPKAA